MVTLGELLDNFGLSEDAAEQEKTASEKTVNDEQELIDLLEQEGQTKTAGETEMSLADLYLQLTDQDEQFAKVAYEEEATIEKIAELEAEEELAMVKVAQEYDIAGRFIARGFWDEFHKIARELEEGTDASTPALGDRGTQWQMETNYEDKGKIDTSGGEQQHKAILKGQADGPAGKAEGAMGPQFATAQHLVTGRATQTNAQ